MSMSTNEELHRETERKATSESRKKQNRIAQKSYRERKKQRLRDLERLANSQGLLSWQEPLTLRKPSDSESASEVGLDLALASTEPSQAFNNGLWTDYPQLASDELITRLQRNSNATCFIAGGLQADLQSIPATFPMSDISRVDPLPDAFADFGDDFSGRAIDFDLSGGAFNSFHAVGQAFQPGLLSTPAAIGSFNGTNIPFLNTGSTQIPTPPEDYLRRHDIEMGADLRVAKRRVIPVYRPSGSITEILPSEIRKYFFHLPPYIQDLLARMARSQDYSFVDVICAGITSLTTENGLQPSASTPSETSSTSGFGKSNHLSFQQSNFLAAGTLANPYMNHLFISRTSYFAATFINASGLGFDFGRYLDENSTSPLYRPELRFASESELKKATAGFSDVAKDLRPVTSQLTQKHHPYLDVLPFPTFRQRAIISAATNPPLLDEDDLCIDLMINDGLVCWGSPGAGTGMDSGAPWDSRSWEAKPWFIEKWWWLVGDKDDEIRSGSRWWQMIRRQR